MPEDVKPGEEQDTSLADPGIEEGAGGGGEEKDERGVSWKNRALENARKLEKASSELAQLRQRAADADVLLEELRQNPEALDILMGRKKAAASGTEDDDLTPEERELTKNPQQLVKYLLQQTRSLREAQLASQHVTQQTEAQQAYGQFHTAIGGFMEGLGFDAKNEAQRTFLVDATLAELQRRAARNTPVQGTDGLREVFQEVLTATGLQPGASASKSPGNGRPKPPPSTSRPGAPQRGGEAKVDFGNAHARQQALARLLEAQE